MDLKNLKEIKERLEEEYNKIREKINKLNKKIWLIDRNSFENKTMISGYFAIILWAISFFFIPKIAELAIIPLNLITPLLIVSSILIGTTVTEVLNKKLKIKQQFRKFSKAKTQKEIMEESIRYDIEKGKLESANKILEKISDNLIAKENLVNSLSSYNITEKYEDNRTKQEISSNIEDINDVLTQKQQKLEIAATKCVLKDRFHNITDKYGFLNTILFSAIVAVMSMVICTFPIIHIHQMSETVQIETSLLEIFTPAIIGELASAIYFIKKRINQIALFKKCNEELGEDALPRYSTYEENQQLDIELENIINDIYTIRLELETEKQKLKNVTSISNSESVMNNFIKKLDNNDLKRDRESDFGEELKINDEFIDDQLEAQIIPEFEEPSDNGIRLLKKDH